MAQGPPYTRPEFSLFLAAFSLFFGALLGARWASVWYVTIALIAACVATIVAAILYFFPAIIADVPNRIWIAPLVSAIAVGALAVLLYLFAFAPRPNITLLGQDFVLVPYGDSFFEVGIASFISDGKINARHVR